MLAENRKDYVLEKLSNKPFVTVAELSKDLGISEVSVRKLLEQMEKLGFLKRSWGGAVGISSTLQEFSHKQKATHNLEEKKAVAKAAYDLISDGESVFMDSGTTTLELAKLIVAGNKRNILVATNALNIAMLFKDCEDIQVIVIGGEFRPHILCTTGFIATDTVKTLFFDKSFVTGNHFSLEFGFSTPVAPEAKFKSLLLSVAKESYFLLDFSKFGTNSLYQIAPLGDATATITDWHAPQKIENEFSKIGAKLIVAMPVSSEKTYSD